MIDLREARSVTEFQRNIKEYVGRLKEKKPPPAERFCRVYKKEPTRRLHRSYSFAASC